MVLPCLMLSPGAARERCEQIGVRPFAMQAGVDPVNLAKVLAGRRAISRRDRMRLADILADPAAHGETSD
jgi:hypothetical protein